MGSAPLEGELKEKRGYYTQGGPLTSGKIY